MKLFHAIMYNLFYHNECELVFAQSVSSQDKRRRIVVGVMSHALKQSIFIKIKLSQISLERHSLNDAPYWNPDMMIREQRSGHHRLIGIQI
jgi:hypothetical protein